jgi:hypothetical protein
MAAEHGLDFATALLYDRLRRSEQHGPFIRRIAQLLERPPEPPAKMDALLAVVPGAFYQEMPRSGADGSLLRSLAAELGCRTALVPTKSSGPVAENGRILLAWLAERAGERIVLASLSKGAADVKAALAEPGAETAFRPVVAWLSLSGFPMGTPAANWARRFSLPGLALRAMLWWKGLDFAVAKQIEWGPGKVLDFPLRLPPHVRLVNVVGFPLGRHWTSKVLRGLSRRLAPLGPNDGLILLADSCALPGVVCPVWGADHNLRPAWNVRRLVAALAHDLAERAGLWASAERGPCPTTC